MNICNYCQSKLSQEGDTLLFVHRKPFRDYEEDYSNYTFYHGTSDALKISNLLPPCETCILREDWRKDLVNKVFFTDSLYSARKFAKKACTKFGGNPIEYVVQPTGDIWHVNTNEYVADSTAILRVV